MNTMTTEPMRLLFLDIDGVLNAHEPLDPDVMCGRVHAVKVGFLNRVLRVTGARIVLSSAWRYFIYRNEMTLEGIDWLFRSHGILAGRVIGITRPDKMVRGKYDGNPATWPMPNERGAQISDWLRANGGNFSRPYAVVDDLDLGITAAGHPFVQTEGSEGLTYADSERLIDLLTHGGT